MSTAANICSIQTVRIRNLRLRTIIGIRDFERTHLQDVIINVDFSHDASRAAESDRIEDTVDYKAIKKKIVTEVQNSSYHLLDALANRLVEIVLEDEMIVRAAVEIDKPHALRFADSVSVRAEGSREE